MQVIHYFRSPGFSPEHIRALLDRVRREISPAIEAIETEYCFNVEVDSALEEAEDRLLRWLLAETFEPERFGPHSYLNSELPVIEVGPR